MSTRALKDELRASPVRWTMVLCARTTSIKAKTDQVRRRGRYPSPASEIGVRQGCVCRREFLEFPPRFLWTYAAVNVRVQHLGVSIEAVLYLCCRSAPAHLQHLTSNIKMAHVHTGVGRLIHYRQMDAELSEQVLQSATQNHWGDRSYGWQLT